MRVVIVLVCAVLTAFLTICAAEEVEGKDKEQPGKMMGVMKMVGTGRNTKYSWNSG